MAITLAVAKQNVVEVFDGNSRLCSIPFYSKDELVGFTSSSVSIRRTNANTIETFNEKGQRVSTVPAR
ncbi:hypothetical protein [Campylobacter upsaliensis]|uniref:hypothetical protein n=1 Tax=Campylobacter upsaliensis TaxID=28080 RepID=UPI001792B820|nr:hypothetical protein [Campylobacter upsaliensis]EAH5546599.1 hypothetical protein [Campylobacter upsaliensis]MEB2803437.1 hypothetical protein [Campylobacter upsaliensis]MEB2806802.1 hypothetical protein [Campylobacter upsaliensis]MEB2811434.1 hypothetical protein [Campylobacter upsaliensis]MEB2816646.1 hypothetical protein [Campylobacter upsaliensis]